MAEKKKLIIPVYLNQKIVFDLLAMLRGGLTTVTKITSNSDTEGNISGKVSARFGLSDALSTLFKVDLSSEMSADEKDIKKEGKAFEKIHTPASLFYELRNILTLNNYVVPQERLKKAKVGDFVEFEASLRRNPMYEIMGKMQQSLELAKAFGHNDGEDVSPQIELLKTQFTEGKRIDVIADFNDQEMAAVISLETLFLRDPEMSDIVDGRFTVLGKVVKVASGKTDKISLYRNTALSIFSNGMLGQITSSFSEIDSQDLSIPDVQDNVEGPAIQVVPIAIYI